MHLFAPWVRNIYVVTSGQVPAWLALDHPGVTVVPHAEIMPADALPTFNSHAIETSLHHIPGLAEHWLYFNDDFFLGRPLRPEALFSPAGLSSVFFAQSTIGLSDLPDSAPWLKAAWNNRRLLQHAFGAVTTNALAHAPYAVRTSVLREIEQRFADVVGATTRSPFRSDTDISTLSSFAQHYGLLTGTAYAAEADTEFVNIANPDLDWQLSQLLHREQDFFCLGDHHDHGFRQGRLDELLTTFLREYFPVAAPWEKEAGPKPFRRAISASASASCFLSFLRTLATCAVVSSSAMAADDSYSSTYSSRSASTRFIAASSSGVSTRTFIASHERSARSTRFGATSRPSQSGLERLRPASMKSSTGWWPLVSLYVSPSCAPARVMAARQSPIRS